MINYEFHGYFVYFLLKGSGCVLNRWFDTEEKAVEFIKKNRNEFTSYGLVQIKTGIVDF